MYFALIVTHNYDDDINCFKSSPPTQIWYTKICLHTLYLKFQVALIIIMNAGYELKITCYCRYGPVPKMDDF